MATPEEAATVVNAAQPLTSQGVTIYVILLTNLYYSVEFIVISDIRDMYTHW